MEDGRICGQGNAADDVTQKSREGDCHDNTRLGL
jgi:hypothetical protein